VDKARYLVEAHVVEGRLVSELAAAHGVHRSWIYKLLARYREGGLEALQPRSRRPRSCKLQTPGEVVEAIVALRRELEAKGTTPARRRSSATSPSASSRPPQ
jgi:transposase